MFGKITITYDPPSNDPAESRVSLSFSSEANMKEILRHFERFLRVMEYPLDQEDSLRVECSKDCPKDSEDTVSFSSTWASLNPLGTRWITTNSGTMNDTLY